MIEFGFGRKLHDLKYVEVGIHICIFHIPRIHSKLEGIIAIFLVENNSI